MNLPHAIYILFAFAFGACVGSFLNVVVYRLPRAESFWQALRTLSHPPSHCPKCNTPLAWYDNIPVFGWIMLRGKCRYCSQPISARYPIVEAVTGLLFVFYYLMFFLFNVGPCGPMPEAREFVIMQRPPLLIAEHWPIYLLYMFAIASLLAASLIDAELFIIPLEIPWLMAVVGIVVHALMADPNMPGNLVAGPVGAAVGAGGTAGLIISMVALWRGWLGRSFPQGEPMLEVDREIMAREAERLAAEGKDAPKPPPPYTRGQIRLEIGREMLFLLPPMALSALMVYLTSPAGPWHERWAELVARETWLAGLLGALLGALVGGFVVWLTRILGTLALGKVAMGLGDVHLMFGVGAIVGGGAATVAFFLAPFFGLLLALWMLITHNRRELPYGPYLSMATAFVMLFYCPIAEYLSGGVEGLMYVLRNAIGGPS